MATVACHGSFAASIEDVEAARKKIAAGDYAAAEAECSRMLSEGFTGLMSGTATLIAHLYRGSARLEQNNPDGAIADANKVIEADSTFLPIDYGYALRARARLTKRDREGALLDYKAAIDAARSGLLSGYRTGAAFAERGYGKALLGDLAGAIEDIDAGLGTDGGLLMSEELSQRKEIWKNFRNALEAIRQGRPDVAQAMLLTVKGQLRAVGDSSGAIDQILAGLGKFVEM